MKNANKNKNLEVVSTPIYEMTSFINKLSNDQLEILKDLLNQRLTPNTSTKSITKLNSSKSDKNQGVGALAIDLILEGYSNKEVHQKICDHYGNTRTTYACVAWYRNDLKKQGLIK